MPAFPYECRSLSQVQRLAVNRVRQLAGRREFLPRQGPAQVAGDQRERGVAGEPRQVLRTATAAENRAGGSEHHLASGQHIEKVADLVGAE